MGVLMESTVEEYGLATGVENTDISPNSSNVPAEAVQHPLQLRVAHASGQ